MGSVSQPSAKRPLLNRRLDGLGTTIFAEMSALAVEEFLASPYGLIVDVRMLNFFRYLGGTAAFVFLGLIVASIFVQNFWCRYLCPYGALLGLAALVTCG